MKITLAESGEMPVPLRVVVSHSEVLCRDGETTQFPVAEEDGRLVVVAAPPLQMGWLKSFTANEKISTVSQYFPTSVWSPQKKKKR